MAIQAAIVNKGLTVKAKVSTTGTIQATNPVAVKGFVGRLDLLNDVNSANEVNGAVPVYDATTDTYVVKRLEGTDIDLNVDGGTF